MALTYRTPIEDIVNFFEPQTQALIANSAASLYKNLEEKNCQYFNYYMPALAKKKLSMAGIYLSPFSAMAHSHPVCKTLENYILYSVLPSYINGSFFFLGIKERKLQILKTRDKSLSSVQCINRYVTSADKMRYSNDFVVYNSGSCDELSKHGKGICEPTLRGIMGPLMRHKAKHLFLHDELHYWSSKNLIDFLTVLRPETLLGTVVYPPELLFKQTRSLNEWCYTYDIVGDAVHFFPDGVRSEGYQQPLKGGFLLTTRKILLTDGTVYMVDVVCSKFAHHLVAITKGEALNQTHRSFGPFEATASEELTALSPEYPVCFPVSYELVNKIYRYLRTLKKPDEQSAMAKLSQVVAEPTGLEIDFVESFSRLVISNGSISNTIMPERLKIFSGTWFGKLPPILASRIQSVRELSVNKFVRSLRPYNFTVKLVELRWHDIWDNVFDWITEVETAQDVVGLLEDGFTKPACFAELHFGSTYAGIAPLVDRPWDCLLEVSSRSIFLTMRRMFAIEMCTAQTRKFSRGAFEQFVRGKLQRSTLITMLTRCAGRVQHKDILEFLGFTSWNALARSVISVCMRKLRSYFNESGVHWFCDAFRGNYKFLCSYGEGPGVGKNVSDAWGLVCAAVVQRRCSWAESDAVFTVATQEAPFDAEIPDEHVHLTCSCNLAMEVTDLFFEEHPFVVKERLRNRAAGWYSRGGVGYSYNGGVHHSQGWPSVLEKWCEVNEVDEKYDCCLYQEYDEGASIGMHSDNEPLFEPHESILTINLCGCAVFSVKCAAGAGSTQLNGAVKFEMPMGFQETHKHSVSKCSQGRASVTFRCLRRVVDTATSHECAAPQFVAVEQSDELSLGGVLCRVEKIGPGLSWSVRGVPADGSCFWHSVAELMGVQAAEIKKVCKSHEFEDRALQLEMQECMRPQAYTTNAGIIAAAIRLRAEIRVWDLDRGELHIFSAPEVTVILNVQLAGQHFEPMYLKNGCVVRAVAAALDRREVEVCAVIERKCAREIIDSLWSGGGVDLLHSEQIFACFGIAAHVVEGDEVHMLNESGANHYVFELKEGHLSYNGRKKDPCGKIHQGSHERKMFPKHVVQQLQACGKMFEYTPDATRAGILADSLHSACTGVLGSELFNGKVNSREYFVEPKPFEICMILGTFGSGKSTLFKRLLEHGTGRIFDFVSPRRALANEFMESVGLARDRRSVKQGQENWRVSTFEKFLARLEYLVEGQVLIFDEVQLYPPGYFDLVLMQVRVGVQCFFTGDPAQSEYDSEKDRIVLSSLEDNMHRLIGGSDYPYKIRSHRFLNSNFIRRLPCFIEESECTIEEPHELRMHLETITSLEECFKQVVLVSSFDEKLMVTSHLPQARVLTFGESTGLTFKYGTILITGVSERTSERRWVTALSRFRMNVCLLNCCGFSFESLVAKYRGRFLSKFLCQCATPEDLRSLLPGEPKFKLEHLSKIGKDEGLREEKMQGDPWLKTMINLYQAPDQEEVELPEAVVQEEWFRTHLPRDELESVRAQWVHKILAKEAREVRIGDLVSEQFTDEHSKQVGARQLTNAAERFETIYPRHRANDTVTFIMAVKKRLSFSKPGRERAKLHAASNYGKALLKEFLARVPLKPMHNKRFMDEALWNFEEKKLSKSAATIENHSGRSCRDWPIDMAQIFSKSQLCTKFDNRFRVAKAAQSIVCFQHAVLCRFAPFMRYIEMKVHEVLPKNYYIHSGKGLDELNAWVKQGKFDGVCTESDYEAFDASQDEYIMAFEIELMKFLRLPFDLIEDYKFIKTSLGSKLGNFAIMRFSGEASTFLFNTLANMLFTFMRYNIRGDEYICFAGDDMCASRRLQPTQQFARFLDKLKLKAKVQFTCKPTFCGWHLCPDGIYKKPQLVLERMCIAKELNNLGNCIDNYAIEVAFAYQLGERAVNRMDEEEVSAFYNCVRIIVRNKHLIKSEVRQVFEVL
nr:replicase [Phlox virus M]